METRHVTIGSTRLAVHLAGRGPLAVLVHGYPLDHRLWLDTMHGPLAEQRTLAAVDLRGHGDSPWSGDQVHTMDQFADDVAAVVRTLSDHAVDVVGLSMGGYAAQALWAKHPTFVRSLAFVNTRAVGDDAAAKAGRDAAITTVLEKGRSAIASAMLGKLLAQRPANDEHAQLLQARVRTMITSLPVETFVADLRGLRDRPDRTSMLDTILVPTLVVTGSEDPIATPAESRSMAGAIRGARCVVLNGCAHLTPMEDPVGFARELGGFWRGVE